MKKIICPKCGEVKVYYVWERVQRALLFNADDEPCGATEDLVIYAGKTNRCQKCDSKIRIEESEERTS